MDAVRRPMEHGPQLQPALHVTPGLFDALQLLVVQRHVLGAQSVVVTVDHELAVELLGGSDLVAIEHQAGVGVQQRSA
jgi:hypothetical protein